MNTLKKINGSATAPSNLALIKYAGKKDRSNLPLNPSLSYSLDHLITKVRISSLKEREDRWQSLKEDSFYSLKLSPSSVKRFLTFFKILKKTFGISGSYLVESANNFPASIGAASSASSFCALTKATYEIALQFGKVGDLNLEELSAHSRAGSGSSCRSFFTPWAFWEGKNARPLNLPFPHLHHQLILVDSKEKKISSSAAHEKIVQTSAFKGRIDRAQARLADLLEALQTQNWKKSFEIVWEEFQDLHALYESAGIFYRNKKSLKIIKIVQNHWNQEKDGPWLTMDAGSSVHLLYRPDQKKLAEHFFFLFGKKHSILQG